MMRSINYSELPDEVNLPLAAALLGTKLSSFMAYLEQEGIMIYDGAKGYPVISVDQFKEIHFRKFMGLIAII